MHFFLNIWVSVSMDFFIGKINLLLTALILINICEKPFKN